MRRLTELPEKKQYTFASFILAELDSEEHWDVLFSESQSMLSEMAREAISEELEGSTQILSLRHDFETN